LQSCIEKAKLQKISDYETVEMSPIPNKYGAEKVACFSAFDSRFFTYLSDKRKTAVVELKIRFKNGTIGTYRLHRGQQVILTSKVMVSLLMLTYMYLYEKIVLRKMFG
jgi:hypothetical protein